MARVKKETAIASETQSPASSISTPDQPWWKSSKPTEWIIASLGLFTILGGVFTGYKYNEKFVQLAERDFSLKLEEEKFNNKKHPLYDEVEALTIELGESKKLLEHANAELSVSKLSLKNANERIIANSELELNLRAELNLKRKELQNAFKSLDIKTRTANDRMYQLERDFFKQKSELQIQKENDIVAKKGMEERISALQNALMEAQKKLKDANNFIEDNYN